MSEYCRYLKSDIYKLRHSWFFPLHFIFPVCGAALMLLYAILSKSSNMNKLAGFSQIIAIAYPFVISIVCQIIADQEMQAGHCQNILILNRRKEILSKFSVLIFSGLFSVLLSTILFGVTFSMIERTQIPFAFFVAIPIVIWISNIMLYGFHLLLAFRFGRNIGIGFGAVGSLLSALLQTGLGTGLWFVIPYGLGIHFVENTLAGIFNLTISGMSEIKTAIVFCILATCVIMIILQHWFSRYSGTHTE